MTWANNFSGYPQPAEEHLLLYTLEQSIGLLLVLIERRMSNCFDLNKKVLSKKNWGSSIKELDKKTHRLVHM